MVTQEMINEAVDNCMWRQNVGGVIVCSGDIVPCYKHINDGRCDTLKKLFTEDAHGNEA